MKSLMQKKWFKWLLFVVIIAIFSVAVWAICYACGVASIEGLRTIIENSGVWGWLVFLLLQVAITTLLCFVPATSMTFIVLSVILFGAWEGFAISATGVLVSSMSMFFVGRFGGEKLAKKLVGEEELKKAQDLVAVKSKIYLPLMFLFPAFPDDALCMVAGMTKMRWWEFLLIVLFCRTIGVATTCFLGSDFINWQELSIIDWFVFLSVCALDVYAVIKISTKIEERIKNRKKEQDGAE